MRVGLRVGLAREGCLIFVVTVVGMVLASIVGHWIGNPWPIFVVVLLGLIWAVLSTTRR